MYFRLSRFFLFATPFTVAIVTTSTLFPFIVGKYVFFRTSVALAAIFFLVGLLFEEDAPQYLARLARAVRSPLGIAITLFTAVFLLAGFLGVDPAFSFWSNFERGEGGFQMLHLYALFLLLATLMRNEKDWRRLIAMTLLGATLMIGYGVLAGLGPAGAGAFAGRFIGQSFGDEGYRFSGSIGNSSYVAAYLVFIMGFASYLMLSRSASLRSWRALVRWGMIAFFFVFFILAATRGAFLGLIAAALVFLAYLAYSRPAARKWLMISATSLVLAVTFLVQFRNTAPVRALPFARIFDISFSAETFGHRRLMWRIAWDGWKERPLLGWGPENYIQVFDRHFDTRYYQPPAPFGAWFDRAHSIIFDYLVETGIFGLAAYIGVFGAFFTVAWRRKLILSAKLSEGRRTLVKALFLALPVAYLVQGLILFDVLIVHLILFTFFAFALHAFGVLAPDTETSSTHA